MANGDSSSPLLIEVLVKDDSQDGDTEGTDSDVTRVMGNPWVLRWGSRPTFEDFGANADKIKAAVQTAVHAVVTTLNDIEPASGKWAMDSFSATFGVTVTAEIGAVVTAGGSATIEVTATFTRDKQGV